MNRLVALAACAAALGATGCTTVRLTPTTFKLPREEVGCPVTFYRLPPRVPYREISAVDIASASMDPQVAERSAARHACEVHGNAVVVTMETVGGRSGVVLSGVIIQTETSLGGAPASAPAGDTAD